MRRNYWVVVANIAVLALVAGCRDNVVAPTAVQASAPAAAMLAPTSRPSLSLSGTSFTDGSADFTISPSGGVYYVGNHAVVFPAHSVCDPDKSTYGPGTWDDSCPVLNQPLTIHAVVRNEAGRTWVEFTPDIRFVPSQNPAKWVWLYMYTPEAIGATGDLSRFNILYATSFDGPTIDESLTDPTVRTYVDTTHGITFRRIRHFTNYVVGAERCDPTTDPSCTDPAPQ